eukprot:UN02046
MTMEECVDGMCLENGCNGNDYDAYRTCQCTEECAEYGNCCEDYMNCDCSDMMTPCECKSDYCGWDSETDSCMGGSTTSCSECTEGDECVGGGCAENLCNGKEYDANRTCQCTAECADYGNCCHDYNGCTGAMGAAPQCYNQNEDLSDCLQRKRSHLAR